MSINEECDSNGVHGSNPCRTATFPEETEVARTDSAQIPAESEAKKMKFPLVVRHRKAEATIYGKTAKYPFYRLAYYSAGKRHVRSFSTYSKARTACDKVLKAIASSSEALDLTAAEARDARLALGCLRDFRRSTGRELSLLEAVSDYTANVARLRGHTLREAIDGFNRGAAVVQRRLLKDAVNDFVKAREHRTEAKEGKRAQLSKGYAYSVKMWLEEFAKNFPNTAVCDLTKELLGVYMATQAEHGPKTRNHKRATVKMFLTWCTRQDYLPLSHRLFEADCFAREVEDDGATDFYRPSEFRKLLEAAQKQESPLLPVIALAGLAGLRIREIMRLTWSDIWSVAGHIEVSASKSKTRQRRLVTIVPALSQWLSPYRRSTGPIWADKVPAYYDSFAEFRQSLEIKERRNGFRHAFCTYHFALHANENLTAQQAGNTPAVVHKAYKGLATKAEARKWFAVKPAAVGNVIHLTPRAAAQA